MQALMLDHQRVPAVYHLGLHARPGRLFVQIDAAQVADQGGIACLAVQGVGERCAAHQQVAKHAVVAGADRLTQVQAKLLIARQAHAFGEQFQIGGGGDALITLAENRRAPVAPWPAVHRCRYPGG